jgi:hypothetical protein
MFEGTSNGRYIPRPDNLIWIKILSEFSVMGAKSRSGLARLEQPSHADPQTEVWGVLKTITHRELLRVDASEGIP